MANQVLVLEDNEDLREVFGELLTSFGLTPLLVRGVAPMMALGADALHTKLAILDINLGPREPSGLDAYTWLRNRGYSGQIIFLTGHAASNPLVNRACEIADARVLEKPLTIDQLATLVRESGP